MDGVALGTTKIFERTWQKSHWFRTIIKNIKDGFIYQGEYILVLHDFLLVLVPNIITAL